MMIDFIPSHTFISTGDKTAMYTLREAGTGVYQIGRDRATAPASFHIRNLSTDKDTALERGAYYSELAGLPFRGNSDFDLNEIKRMNAEESERKRREEAEYIERVKTEAIEKTEIELSAKVFPKGKYVGWTAAEVAETGDKDYLYWLAGEHIEPDEIVRYDVFYVMTKIATEWVEENPKPISEWVGEIGEKMMFNNLTLTKKFLTTGQFTTTLFRFVDESGNVIVTFSTAKGMVEIEKGDVVNIEATVKNHEHSIYEDEGNDKVTIIKRPKVK